MSKNQTVIIPVNCSKSHKKYYLRYDFSFDGVWVLSYALKNLPSDGKYLNEEHDGKSTVDLTNSRHGPQYKGCPYCGNETYVRCGCGGLSCWHDGSRFVCAHCGDTAEASEIKGGLTELKGKGGRTQL